MPELDGFSFFASVFALPFALILAKLLLTSVEDGSREGSFGPTFIETILGVLSTRTMPKVLRVYASRIITAVANFSSRRNRAFEFCENKSMRQSLPLSAIFSPTDLSVTKVCAGIIRLACVVPASGFEIDFYSKEDPLPWLK